MNRIELRKLKHHRIELGRSMEKKQCIHLKNIEQMNIKKNVCLFSEPLIFGNDYNDMGCPVAGPLVSISG